MTQQEPQEPLRFLADSWQHCLKAALNCNNEDLLQTCGISPTKDIMLPKYYQPKKLKWTRYLGHFGYDPLNNCSKFSFDYSMTCQLKLQMMSLPKTRKCRVKMQSQNIIDTCAKSNNAYICRLYRFPVRYDGKLYSNPHCALCNGININATQYIGMCYTTGCKLKQLNLKYMEQLHH